LGAATAPASAICHADACLLHGAQAPGVGRQLSHTAQRSLAEVVVVVPGALGQRAQQPGISACGSTVGGRLVQHVRQQLQALPASG
jgi:hypothetical protein